MEIRSSRRLVAAAVSLVLPASASAQVSGTVVDASNLLPIAGALVTQQATTITTTTAVDGSFSLPGAVGNNLTIVAARKSFYNESVRVNAPATGVQIRLTAVPQEEDPTYELVHPNQCGVCHDDQIAQWTGSPMARAGTNTWTYDLYDGTGTPGGLGGFVYTRDSEHAASNPESECASCHQPEPWVMEPFTGLEPIDDLSEPALHGVSCEVCHKIAHIDETRKNFPGIWPGVVTFTRPSAASGQVQYGVLGDTDFEAPAFMRPSYQPQLVAAACAACHQDKNDPDGDGDFEEENGVISEPTYGEWLATPYADPQSPLFASCVDCHMPSYGDSTVSSMGGVIRDPETIRHHRIEGTTAAYLENAASMSVVGSVSGLDLDVTVSITNDQTGHHVPTGVTVRNMILLVDAWRGEDGLPLADGGTQVVHDLGGIGDPAEGYYAGLPGKLFAKVPQGPGGEAPVFFTEATGILWDNRIPALATDVSHYTFQVPPGGGTLHVRARLVYRRAFRALVDAKGWTHDGHGNPLEDVAPPWFGHLMEEEEWSAIVTGAGEIAAAERAMSLFQNRPNPARTATMIRYELRAPGDTRLSVFDLQGRLVATLAEGFREAGTHAVEWNGRDRRDAPVAAGVYLYRLETSGGAESRRMVWLR
jgi:hypothetical protein